MAKTKKQRKLNGRIRIEAHKRVSKELSKQQANRKAFVDSLDDLETKKLIIREFAKLGLYQ